MIAAALALGGCSLASTPTAPASPPEPAQITTSQPDTTGDFCSTHSCIANFDNGSGYIVQCQDGTWSHSGGLSGACSDHGGEGSTCADDSGNTIPCSQSATPTESAPTSPPAPQSATGNDQGAPSTNTIPSPTTPTSQSSVVPDLKGDSAAAATSALKAAGFSVSQSTKTVTDRAKNGSVLAQSPGSGASANKGSTVTIVVGQFQQPTGGTPTTTTGTVRARHVGDPRLSRETLRANPIYATGKIKRDEQAGPLPRCFNCTLAQWSEAEKKAAQANSPTTSTSTTSRTSSTPSTTTQTRPPATSTGSPSNPPPPSTSGPGIGSWGLAAEASFMSNCDVTSGGNESSCRCMLGYLESNYTEEQAAPAHRVRWNDLHDPRLGMRRLGVA